MAAAAGTPVHSAAPVSHADPDGVLLVDKPAGPTSHDIVDAVRRHFRFRKVGHGGSLDPQATGLLVLLVGRATRISNLMLTSDKTYTGVMRFGVTTDSYDMDGVVLAEADASGVTRELLETRMKAFEGDRLQMPPMVSAVKKDGVPLYKLARRGLVVEREARLIHIYSFRLQDFHPPCASFLMHCTKGTYVRAVCHELGQACGCGAALAQLRRTRSGVFKVEDAIQLEDVLKLERDALVARFIPIHVATTLQ